MEVTKRRGRRRKKLLDDLKERRGYSHLKEEALNRTMWMNRFGGGFEPVVRQNTEWMQTNKTKVRCFSSFHSRTRKWIFKIMYVVIRRQTRMNKHLFFPSKDWTIWKITSAYQQISTEVLETIIRKTVVTQSQLFCVKKKFKKLSDCDDVDITDVLFLLCRVIYIRK
jgi:transposase-like protein